MISEKKLLQLAISNGEECLGETEVSKDVCAETKPKLPLKCTSFRETKWAHGCGHIGFPKSCYDGKHANVSGVRR